MEYIHSENITKYKGDCKELAYRLMDFFIRQLIVEGYVHGDPHNGNIGVLKDGTIVAYDFGNVIEVSDTQRQVLKECIYFLFVRNKKGVVSCLKKLDIKVLDDELLYQYIDLYIEYLETIDISKFKTNMSAGPQVKLPLKLSDKIFKLIRVYGILEGTCKQLYNEFNYFDLLSKYVANIFLDDEFLMYKANNDIATFFMIKANEPDTKKSIQMMAVQPQRDTSASPSPRLLTAFVGLNFVLMLCNIIQVLSKK